MKQKHNFELKNKKFYGNQWNKRIPEIEYLMLPNGNKTYVVVFKEK